MKIEYFPERSLIQVGKAEITLYCPYKNAREWAKEMLRQNDVIVPHGDNIKTYNKRLGDEFGCSIAVLYKHFNKLQKKAFIVPVYHLYKYVNLYNGFKKGANISTIAQLNTSKDLLNEVYNDKLYNLLPVVNALGKSPKELKDIYGKSWKNVTKNSVTKNKLLVNHYRYGKDEKRKELFEADIPSTLLKYSNEFPIQSLIYLKEHFKGQWKNYDEMKKWVNIFTDSSRLAEKLDKKFNPKWSPRRMKEEHDRMSKELAARRYSPIPFEWTKELPRVIEHEGYVATILDSRFLIAEEGNHMGHCVAGYADWSANGDYLVYSVTKDGERSSTIGLNMRAHTTRYLNNISNTMREELAGWSLQQHYGRFNASLKVEAEKEIGKLVVEALNNRMKEKQECTH
jgi:hypothetical protein